MHAFSLASALLLAVAGFAAAAPTADSVQTISDIISSATAQLKDLSPADAAQINAIAASTNEQVQAAVQGADLTPSDAESLRSAVDSYAVALGAPPGTNPGSVSSNLDDLLNALGALLESLGL